MFAALQWMGARSEQGLSQVAATQHLALAQDGESEMAAGRTALVPFEGLKLSVIDKAPPLHQVPLLQYACTAPGQRGLATVIRTSAPRPRFIASTSLNADMHQAVGRPPAS